MLRNSLPYRCLEWKDRRRYWSNPPRSNHTAVRITGGIGDLIVSLPAAQALNKITRDVVVYSKWPEISRFFAPELQADSEKSLCDRGLDWIINLCGPATFQFANNFRGFRKSKMNEILVENRRFMSQNEFGHIAECHPFLDCVMADKATRMGLDRRSISFAFLGLPFKWPDPMLFPHVVTIGVLKSYITVHDGFDNLIDTNGSRATKTWNLEHWEDFVRSFKRRSPGVKVIQLGGSNSRHINGVDIDFRGQLTFIASVMCLSGSRCHVDGDSGLVHAANRVATPCVVMFGPTDMRFFKYPEHVGLRHDYCGGCWWSTADWMSKCPIGFETPRCMDHIGPQSVLEEVVKIVGGQREAVSTELRS